MKMTIGPYSILLKKAPKTKTVTVDISGKTVLYQIIGEELTLLEGVVPEDLKPILERTIRIHFRTKV